MLTIMILLWTKSKSFFLFVLLFRPPNPFHGNFNLNAINIFISRLFFYFNNIFLKKLKYFFIFLDYFDILMLKINFKK